MTASGTRAFTQAAQRLLPLVERELDRLMPEDGSRLTEAMRYSLLLPGKRIRPLLVLLSCEATGGAAASALPAACAVEMTHTFSLIHDDLPGMDNDDLRRGKPTNHKIFGEAEAILAGDALLAQAFATLAGLKPAEIAVRCMRILAEATGAHGMCGGQSLDMRGPSAEYTLDELKRMHSLKTGALIEACIRMGATIAEAAVPKAEALGLYGRRIGLLFQVTDDLLDRSGDSARLGKTAGKDATQRKNTFPRLLGEKECQRTADALLQEALTALEMFGDEADALRSLATMIRTRDH
jgi:geranylgeranyl diphosphate synthase, type II